MQKWVYCTKQISRYGNVQALKCHQIQLVQPLHTWRKSDGRVHIIDERGTWERGASMLVKFECSNLTDQTWLEHWNWNSEYLHTQPGYCLPWLAWNRNILPCRSLLTISLLELPAHYSLVLKLISSFSEEEHGYKAAAHWVNMKHIKMKFPQWSMSVFVTIGP